MKFRNFVLAALVVVSLPAASLARADQQAAADTTAFVKDVVAPPTELPPLVTTALGLIAPFVFQFVTNRFKTRAQRFVVALVLSAATGAGAYAIVRPEGIDIADYAIYWFAWAQIGYQVFWRALWDAGKLNIRKPRV